MDILFPRTSPSPIGDRRLAAARTVAFIQNAYKEGGSLSIKSS